MENKAKTSTAEEEKADATEVETEEKSEVETEEAHESSSTNTDYDALIAAERERAERAEKALAERAFKERQSRKVEIEPEEDEEKPLTKKDLARLLQQERETTEKRLQEARAMEYVRNHTSSEQEANAALLYWKNRVVPTGNLEEDLSFAIAGLSFKKVQAKNLELARALKGKGSAQTDNPSVHQDSPQGTAPKMDALTAASYKRAGFDYDAKERLWKKKLPNGKFLVKDPRTKQLRTI